MSRYVNLEGNTWDGTPITSKIQEVKTRHGFMQGITIGWLWGDNIPHIDLEEHDKQIRNDAIEEYKKKIEFEEKWLFDCKVFNPNVAIAFETLKKYAEQLKEQNK